MMRHTIFGVRIDDVSAEEVAALFAHWFQGNGQHVVVTPNAEFLLLSRKDAIFCDTLKGAALSLPDGVSLRFAVAALTGNRLKHRVTGVDALHLLADATHNLLLIGGDAEEGNAAAARLGARWIDVGRVGDDGTLDPAVVARISALQPEAIAAALGGVTGKQEKCLARYVQEWPSVKVAIGVGGAVEMIAGKKRRAPAMLRKIGLESLWRLCIEPRRWRRIANAILVFPAVVVWTTLREQRFLSACRAVIPEIFRQITGR